MQTRHLAIMWLIIRVYTFLATKEADRSGTHHKSVLQLCNSPLFKLLFSDEAQQRF